MKNKNKENICKSVLLTKTTHQKLRMFCCLEEKTITSVVDSAINLYINNNTNKG
tara:strand:+ start:265 stop:426 length:162 start_codon:yes stop_codon:yes gene_type:complete